MRTASEFDKPAYQRELMRVRRAREKKAIALHEYNGRKLSAEARGVLVKRLNFEWAEAREEYLKTCGALPRSERWAAIREFWLAVDYRLDVGLRNAAEKEASRVLS